MAKNRLSGVVLDEVSLVDSPAAHLSKVVLMKRLDPEAGEVEKVEGVQFNLGFKKDGESAVQSVVFDSETWEEEDAKKWLTDHNMKAGKMDATENTLRFRQLPPDGFEKFRMITPGKQVSKALKASQSLSRTQEVISRAVRDAFSSAPPKAGDFPLTPWVRDLYKDSVVFDLDGKVYRAEYTLDFSSGDELNVTFGNKVPVDVAYVDVKKAACPACGPKEKNLGKDGDPDEGGDDEIDELMISRLKKLSDRLGTLKSRVTKYNKIPTKAKMPNKRRSR